MKAKLIKKKDAIKPAQQPEPQPATKIVRPAPKPVINPRAAFHALFAKRQL